MFILVTLACKNEWMRRRISDFLLRDVRMQRFNNKENYSTSQQIYAYDGFVFYDKTNSTVGDWVDHVLVPRLEDSSPRFLISVLGKEDWCGLTQVQQLLWKVRASRKTIVILSKQFSTSPQCQYVLSLLEEMVYVNRRESGIIVSYDGSSPKFVPRCTRRNPYSELHYSTTNENLFWDLIVNAMTFPST